VGTRTFPQEVLVYPKTAALKTVVALVPLAVGLVAASPASAAPTHPAVHFRNVCSAPAAGYAACQSKLVTTASGATPAAAAPGGYNPLKISVCIVFYNKNIIAGAYAGNCVGFKIDGS